MSEEKNKENKTKSTAKETAKSLWNYVIDTIAGVYKKPMTTVKNSMSEKDSKKGLLLLLVIAISYGFAMMAAMKNGLNLLFNGINISSYVDISYLRIFLCAVIIYLIISFIPVVITFLIARIMKDTKFEFRQAINLYATSMSVLIPVNLVVALLYMLNFLITIGVIAMSIIGILAFFVYVLGFVKSVDIKEDRQPAILTALVILWFVISFFMLAISISSMVGNANPELFHEEHYPSIFGEF